MRAGLLGGLAVFVSFCVLVSPVEGSNPEYRVSKMPVFADPFDLDAEPGRVLSDVLWEKEGAVSLGSSGLMIGGKGGTGYAVHHASLEDFHFSFDLEIKSGSASFILSTSIDDDESVGYRVRILPKGLNLDSEYLIYPPCYPLCSPYTPCHGFEEPCPHVCRGFLRPISVGQTLEVEGSFVDGDLHMEIWPAFGFWPEPEIIDCTGLADDPVGIGFGAIEQGSWVSVRDLEVWIEMEANLRILYVEHIGQYSQAIRSMDPAGVCDQPDDYICEFIGDSDDDFTRVIHIYPHPNGRRFYAALANWSMVTDCEIRAFDWVESPGGGEFVDTGIVLPPLDPDGDDPQKGQQGHGVDLQGNLYIMRVNWGSLDHSIGTWQAEPAATYTPIIGSQHHPLADPAVSYDGGLVAFGRDGNEFGHQQSVWAKNLVTNDETELADYSAYISGSPPPIPTPPYYPWPSNPDWDCDRCRDPGWWGFSISWATGWSRDGRGFWGEVNGVVPPWCVTRQPSPKAACDPTLLYFCDLWHSDSGQPPIEVFVPPSSAYIGYEPAWHFESVQPCPPVPEHEELNGVLLANIWTGGCTATNPPPKCEHYPRLPMIGYIYEDDLRDAAPGEAPLTRLREPEEIALHGVWWFAPRAYAEATPTP